MFKQSKPKIIATLFIYFLIGFGIGGILAMILSYFQLIPNNDQLIIIMMLVCSLAFFIFQITRLFNTIDIQEDKVVVSTLSKKHYDYKYSDYSLEPSFGGFSINYIPFVEYLEIRFIDNASGKKKKFIFSGYKKKHALEMVHKIAEYVPSILAEE